jgi:hypothetical protein
MPVHGRPPPAAAVRLASLPFGTPASRNRPCRRPLVQPASLMATTPGVSPMRHDGAERLNRSAPLRKSRAGSKMSFAMIKNRNRALDGRQGRKHERAHDPKFGCVERRRRFRV